MIRETAQRFVASVDESAIRTSDGCDPARWAQMAELGWHGVLADAESGGLDLGGAEMAILAEAVGNARLPEPFIASSITALTALRQAGGARPLLRHVVEGSAILAPIGFGVPVGMTALQVKGQTLSGSVMFCEIGPMTTDLIVYAEGDSAVLVHLPRASEGVAITPFRGIDGRHFARVDLVDVTIPAGAILAQGSEASAAASMASAFGIAATCADAVGCMDRALALTGTYLNERKQFGSALASFQALRHRFADVSVEAELSRSMAELVSFAAQSVDDPTPLLDRARARICRAAQAIGQATIQLHGGMGMTDEMAIGHYFRRLICIQALLGQEAGSLRARAKALSVEIAGDAALEIAQ